MKRLSSMTVDELLDRYTDIALRQYTALLMDRTGEFNRLYDKREDVEAELKSRPGDQRRALLALYCHSNIQVQLNAAIATLALAPEAARRKLQEIENSHEYPQAASAGMAVDNLDNGIFKPT